ncbi:MAG: hypothetical protein WAS07_15700 [Micropruina sp.]
MPNPPRRLGAAGRRLWTAVHSCYQLTIIEGVRLAHACDLADVVARSDEHSTLHDLARHRLALALHDLGLPEDFSPEPRRGRRLRLPTRPKATAVA